MSRWKNRPPIDEQAVVDSYKSLVRVVDIAAKHNVSIYKIHRILVANGIEVLSKSEFFQRFNELPHDRENEIISFYQNHKNIRETSRQFHIGYKKTKNILTRNNVEINDASKRAIAGWERSDIRKSPPKPAKGSTKNVSGTLIKKWEANARQGIRVWELSVDDIQTLYENQQGRCYYTGILMISPLNAKENQENNNSPYKISLDRLDSDKGYVKGNVCFCCSWVNLAKGVRTTDDFIRFIDTVKGETFDASTIRNS